MFHSAIRGVSMALMKSQTPWGTVTKISIAPTPFISGIARFGSVSAARSWAASSSARVSTPSPVGVGRREVVGQEAPARLGGRERAVRVAVERGEQAPGGGLRVDLQARGRVGVAGDRPLGLGPAQHRRRPGRPALRRGPVRARVGLVAEVQQADVPERLRAEAADLDVVLEHGQRLAQAVGPRAEEPALEVVARAPGQDAADVQPLALDLEEHVLRLDALGRVGVVGTAGGVDVVVAAEEAVGRRVDPALEPDVERRLAPLGDGQLPAS